MYRESGVMNEFTEILQSYFVDDDGNQIYPVSFLRRYTQSRTFFRIKHAQLELTKKINQASSLRAKRKTAAYQH